MGLLGEKQVYLMKLFVMQKHCTTTPGNLLAINMKLWPAIYPPCVFAAVSCYIICTEHRINLSTLPFPLLYTFSERMGPMDFLFHTHKKSKASSDRSIEMLLLFALLGDCAGHTDRPTTGQPNNRPTNRRTQEFIRKLHFL